MNLNITHECCNVAYTQLEVRLPSIVRVLGWGESILLNYPHLVVLGNSLSGRRIAGTVLVSNETSFAAVQQSKFGFKLADPAPVPPTVVILWSSVSVTFYGSHRW